MARHITARNVAIGTALGLLGAGYYQFEQKIKEKEDAVERAVRLSPGHVVIVGCGFSGICLGIRLKQAGIPFIILEKNEQVGGTWFLNSYPNAACDVPAHLYSFSFEPKTDWSSPYAPQPEILEYLKHVVEKYKLLDHIRFNTQVDSMSWDASNNEWIVTCGDGSIHKPRYLINAVGALHVPSYPVDEQQRETFQGAQFHSAEWDASVDLTGKRVAVVGSAASAVQLVPAVAKQAKELIIVQRTPNWIATRQSPVLPRYRYSPLQKTILGNIPLAAFLHRSSIYWYHESTFLIGTFDREDSGRLGPKYIKKLLTKQMQKRLGNRQDLVDKLIPNYAPGCKRILRTDDFLETLLEENVTLLAHGLDRIENNGIRVNGEHYPVDVIVYATGFKVGSIGKCVMSGKNLEASGLDLVETAKEAYLGVSMTAFPNSFVMLGANSGLGHNSIISFIECQAAYITKLLCNAIDNNLSFEVKEHVVNRYYNNFVYPELDKRVWTHGGCNSWYLNSQGKNVTLWPASTLKYMRLMSNPPALQQDYNVWDSSHVAKL
mmetsp:Transcript_40904/g.65710  ORF Transcript_40904/g.65710 Transcript_40904/m.65710 type:complete len:547 (+) Transcript_40904:3975-5615(+)